MIFRFKKNCNTKAFRLEAGSVRDVDTGRTTVGRAGSFNLEEPNNNIIINSTKPLPNISKSSYALFNKTTIFKSRWGYMLSSILVDVLVLIIKHSGLQLRCRCVSTRFKKATSLIPEIDIRFSSIGCDQNAADIAKFIRKFEKPRIICHHPWTENSVLYSAVLDCLRSRKHIGSVLIHVDNTRDYSTTGLRALITSVLNDQETAVVSSLGSLKIHVTTNFDNRADLDNLVWAAGFCNIRKLRWRRK